MRLWLLLVLLAAVRPAIPGETVRVGSKKFTENIILGEMARQAGSAAGYTMAHRAELGGTRVLWNALLAGEIDIYPEYTGTLQYEILAQKHFDSFRQVRRHLDALGVGITRPLGFNNTYALGILPANPRLANVRTISDLRGREGLRFGFSNEFIKRADGWPALQKTYGLRPAVVRGMDHDLTYRALINGDIDVMELYSTDAEISYYQLRTLIDDRALFPDYQAVFVYNKKNGRVPPGLTEAIRRLEGRIDAATMSRLNARVKIEKERPAAVAASYLKETLGTGDGRAEGESDTWREIGQRTREHLFLVALSLLAAILIALPLGMVAAFRQTAGRFILSITGMLQTIPSLALLVLMIPLAGIGEGPALIALFLYSLLPIVRGTHAGLISIPPAIRESAIVLGLSMTERLRFVYLPLAARSILSGIKTAAVINVGTATLGALIGAGGYGQPILTGIRLDDTALILQGAIPAALLAFLIQALFDLLENFIVPRGLKK